MFPNGVLGWRVSSNRFTKRAAVLTIAVLASGVCKVLLASDRADKTAIAPTTIDRLINEAALAKSQGNVAQACALLHRVVRIAPENLQARWQLGQVKVHDEWLSIEEAQRRAANDPRQEKYRERKNAIGESPQDQMALARWCGKNELADEARVHWGSVLGSDPNNKLALRALNMRWHDGQLLSPGQLKEARKETSGAKRSYRQWEVAVTKWMRALSDKNESPSTVVLNEIAAVDDVAAIPAFEKVTLNTELSPGEKNPAAKRLSFAFLVALRNMENEPATNSLVRYAVLSPFGGVRSDAITELKCRPLTDFVPTLLDALAAPIKYSDRVETDPDGSIHYLRVAYREGPFADLFYRSSRSIYQPGSPFGMLANSSISSAAPLPANVVVNARSAPERGVTSVGAVRSSRSYEQETAVSEQQVQASNQLTGALNERIVAVLTGVSDQKFGNEPRAWWNWWQDYTDYYRGGDRPMLATLESSNEYVIPPDEGSDYGDAGTERQITFPPGYFYRMRILSCFVRGTPVWTKTGPKPIESLSVGDLVVAQNVNTGEIGFKPVMVRTLRPAGPILQISTRGEKLLLTRGHPLWVDCVGWRMAKEVADGDMLYSVTGTTRVENVKLATDAETYNLVVADFNTYFVGESGILVHDNMPRRPTRAFVPGLVAK